METYTPAGWVPIGYARYGSLAAAKSLNDAPTAGTVLSGFTITPRYAIISVEGQDVRYRVDAVVGASIPTATAPTATEGSLLQIGDRWRIDSYDTLAGVKFIETAASANVRIDYYA